MFNRRAIVKSHSDLFREELGESYDHFKAAASHAPGGAAEFMTPAYDKTRDMASRRWKQGVAVVIPVYETMKDGARNARGMAEKKMSRDTDRNVMPTLLVLLAAGIAIGALGALVMRRRRAAQEWDEFEPSSSLEAETGDTHGMVSAATRRMATGAASVADGVSNQAGRLADSLREKAGEPSYSAFADENETADDMVARAGNQEQMP
ncbi:hypothetical protein [Luedemannella flava]|uniref:hypothetical protein n=1 Tax=Luedemannella flava TaxID=349316 RepID=UPI0031D18D6A